MKRLTILSLQLLLIVAIAGCKNSGANSAGQTDTMNTSSPGMAPAPQGTDNTGAMPQGRTDSASMDTSMRNNMSPQTDSAANRGMR